MIITDDLLLAKGACEPQVELFRAIFPGGVKVPRVGEQRNDLVEYALRRGLDVWWVLRKFRLTGAYSRRGGSFWYDYTFTRGRLRVEVHPVVQATCDSRQKPWTSWED